MEKRYKMYETRDELISKTNDCTQETILIVKNMLNEQNKAGLDRRNDVCGVLLGYKKRGKCGGGSRKSHSTQAAVTFTCYGST